jgi:hypothetical protein
MAGQSLWVLKEIKEPILAHFFMGKNFLGCFFPQTKGGEELIYPQCWLAWYLPESKYPVVVSNVCISKHLIVTSNTNRYPV